MLKLKQIAISEENYILLKSLGKAGDSFNDVVTKILKLIKQQQTDKSDQLKNQSVVDHRNTPLEGGCRYA
jgi:predicted CopG family antitoxin